jgi:nicotinamidase-related amidase
MEMPASGQPKEENMADLDLQRDSTAVVIMDYQNDIVSNYSTDGEGLLQRSASVLESARQAGIPVIYVVVQFREGHPEVLPRNRQRFSNRLVEGTPGAEVHPAVAPQPGEMVVVKRRTGPFSTTDMDAVLHSIGATTLVLFGVATSGCVLTAVRWAADVDYRLVVVSDCCGDQDEEVHRVLTEKIFPRQADVVTAEEVSAAFREAK